MTLETLVSAVKEDVAALAEKMNLQSDAVIINQCDENSYLEYEYNGKKYIRFVGDSNCSGETLSNGRVVRKGVPYWVEVEPIKWIIDEKADVALSKKILFAGVIFDDKVRESFVLIVRLLFLNLFLCLLLLLDLFC